MSYRTSTAGKGGRQAPDAEAETLLDAVSGRSASLLLKSGKRVEAPTAVLDATPALVARSRRRSKTSGYDVAKRMFDLSVGSLLLVMTLPIILAASIWIRLESTGSPFFFQTRLGKHGKPFRIFKLRGMYIDARERYPELYDYSGNRDLDFHFHYNTDPRVTRAGRFLRRTSIDELPNLWNVVMGDMSLIGPRPEIPDILAMYGPYRDEYLSVKPGISCRSKVTGRDELTKRETIEFDLQYIRHRGFSEDLSILWKTILSVVSRRDVY